MRAFALALLLAACKAPQQPGPARVAAAADLSFAFEELGAQVDPRPVFTFGASGMLARQLAEGAPFDVFAAANESYVEQAVNAGACEKGERFVRGRLAVWTASGGVALEALADEKFARIAIANPEVAPYGRAAKEALVSAGLWDKVEKRLVYAENVRQTLQLARSGNVDAAIVSAGERGVLVDAALHAPLLQAIAVCLHGSQRAGGEAFVKLVRSDAGLAVLKKYGFEAP